jgi:hypothetical protein
LPRPNMRKEPRKGEIPNICRIARVAKQRSNS